MDTDREQIAKILLPVIRRILPSIIASEIIGVQPMMVFGEKYSVLKVEEIDGQNKFHILCNDEIWQWIIDTIDESQYSDGTNDFQNRLTISEEAMMILKLKWS